jgi:hypothetical protein
MLTSSVLDVYSSGTASSNTPSSGTTSTTSQEPEFWLGVMAGNGAGPGGTLSGGSGFNNNSTYASGNAQTLAGYQVASSTGTATYSGSSGDMSYNAAAVATFKGVVSVSTTVDLTPFAVSMSISQVVPGSFTNLLVSIAGEAGMDALGNAYPIGVASAYITAMNVPGAPATPATGCVIYYTGGVLYAKGPSGNAITLATT